MRAIHNLRTIFHNVKWQYHGKYIRYRILLSVSIYACEFIVLKSHWKRYPLWGYHLESDDTGSLITYTSQGCGFPGDTRHLSNSPLIMKLYATWQLTLSGHMPLYITVIYTCSSWYANAFNLPSASIRSDSFYWVKISGPNNSIWRAPLSCTMKVTFYIICEAITVHSI
jgi:hypothetical protein